MLEWQHIKKTYSPFERIVGIDKEYEKHLADYIGPEEDIEKAVCEALDLGIEMLPYNLVEKPEVICLSWDDINLVLTITASNKDLDRDSRVIVEIGFPKLLNDLFEMGLNDEDLNIKVLSITDRVRTYIKQYFNSVNLSLLSGLSVILEYFDSDRSNELIVA